MASKTGILTEWSWRRLESFKCLILAPWALHSTYLYLTKDENERSLSYFIILPLLLSRMLHSQIWTSYSRYRTAKGKNRIVDKGIEFEQVDRENIRGDDHILNVLYFYLPTVYFKRLRYLPLWNTNGVIWTFLIHVGPIEFLYYWLHRILHHRLLYPRSHSHHHASIVTQPVTAGHHAFMENMAYFTLFTQPILLTLLMNNASILSIIIYMTFVDFNNHMGHCNFEFIPKWIFSRFPLLKYIIYTPSYHSIHHTKYTTNYALYMPLYDYIYNTMDKSFDSLYESSVARDEDAPNVVHLTHLTTPESIFHIRLGLASLACKPYQSEWHLSWLLQPVTLLATMVARIYNMQTFTMERNVLEDLKLQTWTIPKFSIHYHMQGQRESINKMIEESILKAEEKGVKVLSLGLLNQEKWLNENGELFLSRHPRLKVKLVDGTSLAVAVVLKSIPEETTRVVVRGDLSKVATSVVVALCQRGVQVFTISEDDYNEIRVKLNPETVNQLVLSNYNDSKVWLVGNKLEEREQLMAPKATVFIPYSHFPPKKMRKDCFYNTTPAMVAPKTLQNIDSCENWLPRRVMSTWRVAGIVQAFENWGVHECGNTMFDCEKIWKASLEHGFRPLEEIYMY